LPEEALRSLRFSLFSQSFAQFLSVETRVLPTVLALAYAKPVPQPRARRQAATVVPVVMTKDGGLYDY